MDSPFQKRPNKKVRYGWTSVSGLPISERTQLGFCGARPFSWTTQRTPLSSASLLMTSGPSDRVTAKA